MKFPLFGIGALHFGSFLDDEGARKIVLRALDLGVDFFDTSPLYGNGHSEEVLGRILSKVPNTAFIATKAGLAVAQRKDGQFGVEVMPMTKKNLQDSAERSLKKLCRERIDLFMLHAFDSSTHISETVSALMELHREGKINFFGCSNYNPEQLKALFRETKRQGCHIFLAAQCHYNMLERRAEHPFISLCEENRVEVIINRALARGALSGQYKAGVPYPELSRAAKSWRVRKWLNSHRLSLLDRLAELSYRNTLSLTELALMWLKKKHPKSISLIGVRNVEQLDQCLKTRDLLLNEALF